MRTRQPRAVWREEPWKVIQVCGVVSACFPFPLHLLVNGASGDVKRHNCPRVGTYVWEKGNLLHCNVQDERFHPGTTASLKSLLVALNWEILNLPKSYTSAQMKYLLSSFQKDSQVPKNGPVLPCFCLTLIRMSQTYPERCSELLPAPIIRHAVNFIHKISPQGFRQTQAKSSPLVRHLHLCCICRNESGNMLFLLF